jgi:uncharacterized protein YndB with AHSA1/START domain/uncharacterized protein YciI
MMRMTRVLLLALACPLLALAPGAAQMPAATEAFADHQTWAYFIKPTRPELMTSPTPEESAAVTEHFRRLQRATHEGRVLFAGPCIDMQAPGVVIYEADGIDAAREFFTGDPAVLTGVFTGSFHPINASLLRERDREAPPIEEKHIRKFVTVNAPPEEVWRMWTTSEGMATFFAPKSRIELAPGGAYELYIIPEAEEGQRGSDGCKVLSYIPNEMISFTWNAPPSIPEIRNHEHRTHVVVTLRPTGKDQTLVTLTHLGWLEGPEWDKAHDYFDKAWTGVLMHLKTVVDAKGTAQDSPAS